MVTATIFVVFMALRCHFICGVYDCVESGNEFSLLFPKGRLLSPCVAFCRLEKEDGNWAAFHDVFQKVQ
jgi:hypothetical protein